MTSTQTLALRSRGPVRRIAVGTIAAVSMIASFSFVGVPAASAARVVNLPQLLVDAPTASVVPGGAFTVRVLLTASSKAVIRYTLSGLPSGTTSKLTALSTRERRVRIVIPTSAQPGLYQAQFRTTNRGLKRTDTFSVTVSGPAPTIPATVPATAPPTTVVVVTPQFQISTPLAERILRLGASTSFPIQITHQNQWVGPVRLVVEGLPAGTTAGFLPYNPTSDATSEFRIVAPLTTAVGDYQLSVVATAGDQTRRLPLGLKVRGTESVMMTIASGGSAPVGRTSQIGEVGVIVTNGDGGNVALSTEQLPAGINIMFGQTTTVGSTALYATIAPYVSINTTYLFVIVARKGDASSKSYATVRVVAATAATLRYQASVVAFSTGEVVGFGLAASQSSVTVARGGSAAIAVAITPTGGFANLIDFTVVGLPAGMIAAIEPGPVANTVRLVLSAPSGQARLTSNIRLRATSGTLASEIGLAVKVI